MLTIIVLVLAVALVACASKPATSEIISSTESQEIPSPEPPVAEPNISQQGSDPIYVADAAMYRGTVTEIITEDSKTLFTLEQYKGTDYGAPSINLLADESTRANLDLADMSIGDYLEVFYGGSIEAGIDEAIVAIGVNDLGIAETRNYNGIIQKLIPNQDEAGVGKILMTNLDQTEEMIINYNNNGETQFYLNFDELAVGDKLNIFHDVSVAASMPPQIFALEVRQLAE